MSVKAVLLTVSVIFCGAWWLYSLSRKRTTTTTTTNTTSTQSMEVEGNELERNDGPQPQTNVLQRRGAQFLGSRGENRSCSSTGSDEIGNCDNDDGAGDVVGDEQGVVGNDELGAVVGNGNDQAPLDDSGKIRESNENDDPVAKSDVSVDSSIGTEKARNGSGSLSPSGSQSGSLSRSESGSQSLSVSPSNAPSSSTVNNDGLEDTTVNNDSLEDTTANNVVNHLEYIQRPDTTVNHLEYIQRPRLDSASRNRVDCRERDSSFSNTDSPNINYASQSHHASNSNDSRSNSSYAANAYAEMLQRQQQFISDQARLDREHNEAMARITEQHTRDLEQNREQFKLQARAREERMKANRELGRQRHQERTEQMEREKEEDRRREREWQEENARSREEISTSMAEKLKKMKEDSRRREQERKREDEELNRKQMEIINRSNERSSRRLEKLARGLYK